MGGRVGPPPDDLFAAWASLRLQLDAHRPRPGSAGGRRGGGDAVTRVTPVCLLTGFLGAGKSTLLASLLADAESGRRIAAIVNDVGSLPFDPTLVEWADDVRVELSNGCGCCQSSASLADTLRDTAAAEPPWDLIVVEASGAADPLALAQIVEAEATVTLDRIVTVVPATLVDAQLPPAARSIVDRQIDSAHCIIVSCCDVVEQADLDATVARLAELAPGRTITSSSLDVPAARVLEPSAPRGARLLSGADHNVHRDLVVTTVPTGRPVAAVDLRRELLAARPGLVRVKGRLIVDERACAIQMTPHSLDIETDVDTDRAPDVGGTTDHGTGLTLVAVDHDAMRPLLDLIADADSD